MEEKKANIIMHDDSDEEDDETLSLCDLPIYGESADYSKEDQSSSSSSDGFEFFSEEWSSTSFPADNILFCGKLIPYKEHKVSNNPHKLEINKQPKCINEVSSSLSHAPSFNSVLKKCVDNIGKCEKKNDVLDRRITILKSPTKSRWFLFLFGSTRVSTEMEIREIRKRQNKKILPLRSSGGGRIRGKGWWKLIRALGCSSHHHADAMIKASYGCAPLVHE